MNNEFRVTIGDHESEAKLFSVPDFIGFACREVGKINYYNYSTETLSDI
jgi:hypothetical protein